MPELSGKGVAASSRSSFIPPFALRSGAVAVTTALGDGGGQAACPARAALLPSGERLAAVGAGLGCRSSLSQRPSVLGSPLLPGKAAVGRSSPEQDAEQSKPTPRGCARTS